MLSDIIKTGDRLEITRLKDDKQLKPYVSQVEDISDQNRVTVYSPISYGQLVKLPTNASYSFLFFTEKGMLRYDAVIEKHLKIGGFHMMSVLLKSEGERVQRREYYRLECLLPIRFEKIDPDIPEHEVSAESGIMHDGIVKDLAAGGIRFVTNTNLHENEVVKCILLLDSKYVITLCKILHTQYFPKSNYKYQYRTEFLGLTNNEREMIVQFIFNEQRKRIQKRKLDHEAER